MRGLDPTPQCRAPPPSPGPRLGGVALDCGEGAAHDGHDAGHGALLVKLGAGSICNGCGVAVVGWGGGGPSSCFGGVLLDRGPPLEAMLAATATASSTVDRSYLSSF